MKTILLLLMLMAQRGPAHLPNPTLTPGATLEAGWKDLCESEYDNPADKIPIALKRQIFDRYGLKPGTVGYNVDHLVPTSLGGSNSPKNLWPQSLSGEWNYHMKNRLERTLKKMVCRKEVALEQARQEISNDWVNAYKKYLPKSPKQPSRDPAKNNLR